MRNHLRVSSLVVPIVGGLLALTSTRPSLAAPQVHATQPTPVPQAQPKHAPVAAQHSSVRFVVIPDSSGPVARDTTSGRSWVRVPAMTLRDWAASKSACDALVLGGHSDWRLPRTEELAALLSGPPGEPLPPGHPFTVSGVYWSATETSANAVATVLISNGNALPAQKNTQAKAWCVRGGGNTAYPNSNPRFRVVGNTVEDTRTGRVWQRGAAAKGTWFAVRRACLDRGPGWRLPTRGELGELLDIAAPESPKLPVGHPFFNTWAPHDEARNWTLASTSATAVRTLRFSDGVVASADKASGDHPSRCIKMVPGASWPAGPVDRFKPILGDAAVLDQETRLQWDRAPAAAKSTYPDAAAACAARSIAGQTGWRLASVEELSTLLDRDITSGPLLPAGHPFTGVTDGELWTTSPHATDMVTLDLKDGTTGHMSKTGGQMFGWCVRPEP